MKKQDTASKKPSRKKAKPVNSDIRQAFVACPRCSFFLAGYGLIHEDLEKAMTENDGKWLSLTWNPATQNLVHRSYGVMIRQDDSHYQGICLDCRRPFVFDELAEEPPQSTFRIKISPSR